MGSCDGKELGLIEGIEVGTNVGMEDGPQVGTIEMVGWLLGNVVGSEVIATECKDFLNSLNWFVLTVEIVERTSLLPNNICTNR